VLGGLVTTILLTLFVVPALYLWFGARAAPASSTPYVAVRPAAG
jgi:Cu/Ag efflux pump CusA